ncbi:hypothetical protein A3Q56_03246 [Intoshia linei]|uniref:Major facilitator superfamily (MFS) profile domain-containing protein n=1 Tax=Intoshia linei TaxID=1819745 RepID=A0A177B3R5_9BILA|nr:hypothetical protein A3Q56_03246 [Intoshia linei]
MVFFITEGFAYTLPILLVYFRKKFVLNNTDVSNYVLLAYSSFRISGALAATINNYIGYPKSIFLGSVIITISNVFYHLHSNWKVCLLMNSFFSNIGMGILYYSVFLFTLDYYDIHTTKAIGLASSGSAFGGMAFPYIIQYLVDHTGIDYYMYFLSMGMGLIGLIHLPIYIIVVKQNPQKLTVTANVRNITKDGILKNITYYLGIDILKDKKFISFMFIMCLLTISVYNPFVFIIQHVSRKFKDAKKINITILMSLSRGIGQIFLGVLCDQSKFSNILIFSIYTFISGIIFYFLIFTTTFNLLMFVYISYSFFHAGVIILPSVCLKNFLSLSKLKVGFAYYSILTAIFLPIGSQINVDSWTYTSPLIFDLIQKKHNNDSSSINLFVTLIFSIPCFTGLIVCHLIVKIGYTRCGILGTLIFTIPLLFYHQIVSWSIVLVVISGISSVGLGFFYFVPYLNVMHFFNRHRGVALGFTTLGSAMGGAIFPYFFNILHLNYPNSYMYILGTFILILLFICSFVFKEPENHDIEKIEPVELTKSLENNQQKNCKSMENLIKFSSESVHNKIKNNLNTIPKKVRKNWKHICINILHVHLFENVNFDIFLTFTFIACLFLTNCFVYIGQHVESVLNKHEVTSETEWKVSFVLTVMSTGRGFGQLTMGVLMDHSNYSPFNLLGSCFVMISLIQYLIAFMENYILLLILYGAFSAFFSSIDILPVFCLNKMVAEKHINVSFSFMILSAGISTIIGGQISYVIYKKYQQYMMIYVVSATISLISSFMLIILGYKVKNEANYVKSKNENEINVL